MNRLMRGIVVVALLSAIVVVIGLKNSKSTTAQNASQKSVAGSSTSQPWADGLPRLVDFGAGQCIPCKMMVPILDELKRELAGKLDVEVIDVWQNPEAGKAHAVQAIPTQVFYDASGRELYRHEGFMSKADILARWKELGFDFAVNKHGEQ